MMDFKVVCVSNTVNGGVIIDIEIGKVYEVKEYDETNKDIIYYQIKPDLSNDYRFYHISLFKRLNEFRNERLSEIGL